MVSAVEQIVGTYTFKMFSSPEEGERCRERMQDEPPDGRIIFGRREFFTAKSTP